MPGISITEASGVADSIYGKIQAPLRMFLIKRGEAYEQMSMLPHLFGIGKSNGFGEMSSGLTAFDDFEPVGENGTYPITDFREGFQKLIVLRSFQPAAALAQIADHVGKHIFIGIHSCLIAFLVHIRAGKGHAV